MIHSTPHPLAGTTVILKKALHTNPPIQVGDEYRVEDWWDRLTGKSWMGSEGNPAVLIYAIRTGSFDPTPIDDEVVYGKVKSLGHLLHVSELE